MQRSIDRIWGDLKAAACFSFGLSVFTREPAHSLTNTRYRALLSAIADGLFVKGATKTNAAFGVACFRSALFISVPRILGSNCNLRLSQIRSAYTSCGDFRNLPARCGCIFLPGPGEGRRM